MNARTNATSDASIRIYAHPDANTARYFIRRVRSWTTRLEGRRLRVVYEYETEAVDARGVMGRLHAERAQRTGALTGSTGRRNDPQLHDVTAADRAPAGAPRRAAGTRGTSYGGRS